MNGHEDAAIGSQEDAVRYYRDLFKSLVASRKCIVAMGPIGSASALVKLLRDLGSEPPLVLTDGPSHISPDATELNCHSIVVEPSGDSLSSLRQYAMGLQSPPPEVLRIIEDYDCDKTALVFVTNLIDIEAVAGRPRYDARKQEWIDLENKTVIDSFWDSTHIERAPSTVISPEISITRKIARDLDQGLGTAWAGDNRGGNHFGACLFRWVRTEDQLREACEFFRRHCDFVRIMPFLEGLPCSIHGMVFQNELAIFRPVEIIVLRLANCPKLSYAGTATFWDPSPFDRRTMRNVARSVGNKLREVLGYRGFFNVDGIMTSGGFIPTELNTRMTGGATLLGASLPDLPLTLVDAAVRRGEAFDFRPSVLERLVLNAADVRRRGGATYQCEVTFSNFRTLPIADDGERCHPTENREASAWLSVGPSGKGGFLGFHPINDRIPIGLPFTPLVVRAFAAADKIFGTRIGRLEAAKLVR